jgi:hypothetical protein
MFTSIALECYIPGYDPKTDMLPQAKRWLESNDRGWWLMVLDSTDDAQLFFPLPAPANVSSGSVTVPNLTFTL